MGLRTGPLIAEALGPGRILLPQGIPGTGADMLMHEAAWRLDGFRAKTVVKPLVLEGTGDQPLDLSLADRGSDTGADDHLTSRATAGAAHGGPVGKNAWEMVVAFILASRAAHSAKTIGSLAGHFDWRLAAVVAVAGTRCIGGSETGGHAVQLAHDLRRQGKTLVVLPGPSGRAGPELVGFLRAAAFRAE